MSVEVNDKNLGHATAYAYAKAGGYTGTEEEFTALLGNIATDLAEIENLTVNVTTLPAGSSATASYADGVLSLGIPKGDKGNIGNTPQISVGTVATGQPGTSASVTMTGTADAPIFNFVIPRGDPGEVTQAEFNALDTALKSGDETDAEYHLGFYLDENGDLCQVEEDE